MTKKQIKTKSKVFVWTVMLLLPLIVYALSYYSGTPTTMTDIFAQLGIVDSVITEALNNIFASGEYGIQMVDNNSFMILYSSYAVMVVILRLFINLLVFIPNVLGNLLTNWTRTNEENLL